VGDSTFIYNSSIPAGNILSWTGGYTAGTTQITVSGAGLSNLVAGMYIYLDQLNDSFNPTVTYAPFITCDAPYLIGNCDGGVDDTRGLMARHKVTNKSGSTLTIYPGLQYTHWSGSNSPRVWFAGTATQTPEFDGIEDLSIQNSLTDAFDQAHLNGMIVFTNASNSWSKNVRTISNGIAGYHVYMNGASHITAKDSYHYFSPGASTSYGAFALSTTAALIENNIFQQITTPCHFGSGSGNVCAYNFMVDMVYATPTFNMPAIFPGHEVGSVMHLAEGNETNGVNQDSNHGTSAIFTAFRNNWSGLQPGITLTANTVPVTIQGYTRFNNYVGNVLGTSGYHTHYQSTPSAPTGDYIHVIYGLGWTSAETCDVQGCDNIVITSLLRWGNFDYVTNAVRWDSLEIPSGNAVPASHTLAPSWYLASKPAFFGSVPWPPIGPDVTGGQDVSGHAYHIPAYNCFRTVMNGPADGSGSVLTFNANRCYSAVDTTPPGIPTGVTIQ
jgi:hypothetical protein